MEVFLEPVLKNCPIKSVMNSFKVKSLEMHSLSYMKPSSGSCSRGLRVECSISADPNSCTAHDVI